MSVFIYLFIIVYRQKKKIEIMNEIVLLLLILYLFLLLPQYNLILWSSSRHAAHHHRLIINDYHFIYNLKNLSSHYYNIFASFLIWSSKYSLNMNYYYFYNNINNILSIFHHNDRWWYYIMYCLYCEIILHAYTRTHSLNIYNYGSFSITFATNRKQPFSLTFLYIILE